jgi:PPOX class probable F420-dependent enzyme
MPFDPAVRDLFAGANFVHLATLLPDGAPHSVAIWADVHDDEHVVFFTSPTSRKARNLDGDPRLAMSLVDRDNPYRTGMIRGRLVQRIEGDDGAAIVDRISHKYTGRPFPFPSDLAFVVEVTHSRLFSLVDNFEDTPRT